jgi:hypothetical protein
MWVMFTETRC